VLVGVASKLTAPAAALADDLPRVARRVRHALAEMTGATQSATDSLHWRGERAAGGESQMATLREAAAELKTAAEAAPRDRSGAQPVRVVDPPTPLRDYVMTGTGIAAQVLLVLFLVFFLLSAGDLYKRKFVKLAGPSLSHKKITVQI